MFHDVSYQFFNFLETLFCRVFSFTIFKSITKLFSNICWFFKRFSKLLCLIFNGRVDTFIFSCRIWWQESLDKRLLKLTMGFCQFVETMNFLQKFFNIVSDFVGSKVDDWGGKPCQLTKILWSYISRKIHKKQRCRLKGHLGILLQIFLKWNSLRVRWIDEQELSKFHNLFKDDVHNNIPICHIIKIRTLNKNINLHQKWDF